MYDGGWIVAPLTVHMDCLEALRDELSQHPQGPAIEPRPDVRQAKQPERASMSNERHGRAALSLQVNAALRILLHSWERLCENYEQMLRIQHQRTSAPWPAQLSERILTLTDDGAALADSSGDNEP
jgi:hypothetical protein